MNVVFRASFTRDLKKVKDREILGGVRKAIERAEAARGVVEIGGLKKLSGAVEFYRIRVGDYRIGVAVDGDTIEFVRCLNRRDLYKYFP